MLKDIFCILSCAEPYFCTNKLCLTAQCCVGILCILYIRLFILFPAPSVKMCYFPVGEQSHHASWDHLQQLIANTQI